MEHKQEPQSLCDISQQGGVKKIDWTYTKSLPKETRLWQESLDGDSVGRFQYGIFRKIWVLGSTKGERQMDFFVFSHHQDLKRRDKIRDFSPKKHLKIYLCQSRPWNKNSSQ